MVVVFSEDGVFQLKNGIRMTIPNLKFMLDLGVQLFMLGKAVVENLGLFNIDKLEPCPHYKSSHQWAS